jgi:hypothetical protein
MRKELIAIASILVMGVVACTLESAVPPTEESNVVPTPSGSGDAGAADGASSKDGGGGSADTCPYSGPPIPTDAFAKCRDTGRCIPEGLIPADQKARLASCPTTDKAAGFCVPEKIIQAKGLYLPKACASIGGGEGRCTSRVFPDIDKQKDALPKDVCDESERCAPCWDPITGNETGACRSVACDAPTPSKPKVVFGECCKESGKARGRCVPSATMPQEGRDGLEIKECKGEEERCVPQEQLTPGYVNPKCKASAFFGGEYDGVCISDCVKKDFLTNLGTSQGNCTTGFFCAPCKNPLTGAPTGAPGCQ